MLSKDITNGTKETLGLRDTQPKGIAFLSCEDNMLAIMANTKRLFTQVVSSISYTMQSYNPLGLFVIFLIQVPTIAFRQLRELDHVNLNQVTLHIESHFQSFTIFMPKNLTKPNTHHNQPLPRTTSRFSRMVLSGVSAR